MARRRATPGSAPEGPGPVPGGVQTPLTEVQTPLRPEVKQPPPEEPPSPAGIKTRGQAPRAPEKPSLPQPIRKVPVPSLVGKNREWGRNILIDQGLQEGEVITRQADRESGTIIEQDPDAGDSGTAGHPGETGNVCKEGPMALGGYSRGSAGSSGRRVLWGETIAKNLASPGHPDQAENRYGDSALCPGCPPAFGYGSAFETRHRSGATRPQSRRPSGPGRRGEAMNTAPLTLNQFFSLQDKELSPDRSPPSSPASRCRQ